MVVTQNVRSCALVMVVAVVIVVMGMHNVSMIHFGGGGGGGGCGGGCVVGNSGDCDIGNGDAHYKHDAL